MMDELKTRCCSQCKQNRSLNEFSFKNKAKGVYERRCKHCMSIICKEHYKNNAQAYINRAKVRTGLIVTENRELLFAYLSSHPCIDCGNTDIRTLDFDHVRGKKLSNISKMAIEGYSWPTIENEIAKCEVRCANCHRIKTFERNNSWRQLMQ